MPLMVTGWSTESWGEILHVRPQKVAPIINVTFDDKADIVDVSIAIAVEHHRAVHQVLRVDIIKSAPSVESHAWRLPLSGCHRYSRRGFPHCRVGSNHAQIALFF